MTLKLLFVDVETTGLNPRLHQMLSLACVMTKDEKVVSQFKRDIVHDNYVVSPQALQVNGIDLTKRTGKPLIEVLRELEEWVKAHVSEDENVMLAGQNVGFDKAFLDNSFTLNPYLKQRFSHRVIDTATLINSLTPFNDMPLSEVAVKLGLQVDEARLHTPLYDAMLSFAVFLTLTRAVSKATNFVTHIQSHLNGQGTVICTICKDSIDEIDDKRRRVNKALEEVEQGKVYSVDDAKKKVFEGDK